MDAIAPMSSSVSGKFQDHYIALGVDTKADSDAIRAAYARLAKKYHPDNQETGDAMNFEAVNMAYDVLSDPALRLAFDKLKGLDQDTGDPQFAGAEFFEALKRGAVLRSAVMCILCDRRRRKTFHPTLSMRDVDNMLQASPEELSFGMWYLKQRGYVASDDKGRLQLTAEGMDFLERNPPVAEQILALIKPESIVAASVSAPKSATAADSHKEEPVLNVLQRVLSRDHLPQDVRAVAPRPK
jgi:hypothetical protein